MRMLGQRFRNLMMRLGPGAIIASLTIGSGELIFSTRAGALFGPRVLAPFLVICLLKWVLVYTAGRQMVLRGIHPLESWVRLPGPRGWLPMTFLILGLPCFPIWVAFHANTTASILPQLAGHALLPQVLWANLLLFLCLMLCLRGRYRLLEMVQLVMVLALLGIALGALLLVAPSMKEWVSVILATEMPVYPDWVEQYPNIASRPVWVELSTYVGIVGGSSYDYLCYVAFLREKGWGRANHGARDKLVSASAMAEGLTALRWDTCFSFLCVLIFSSVFVMLGHEILAPRHWVPVDGQLLSMQAFFVSDALPWLRQVYFIGALLAMMGTLYGTLEVGPTIYTECARAMGWRRSVCNSNLSRTRILLFISLSAAFLLGLIELSSDTDKPFSFIWLLTPANLFTGVFGCGLVLAATGWCAFKGGSSEPGFLAGYWKWFMLPSALLFFALGIKGYLDHGGWPSLLILLGSVGAGSLVAHWCHHPASAD